MTCRSELIIIGEAASGLPLEFRQRHPEINWRYLIDTRNVIIHDYPAIHPGRIWAIIKNRLPPLIQQISEVYEAMFGADGTPLDD